MRVMIDTNIFISAALFPKGRAAEALYKALYPPYEPVVCDYVLDELHRKFREKIFGFGLVILTPPYSTDWVCLFTPALLTNSHATE